MSATLELSQHPAGRRADLRIWFVRIATTAIVLYGVLYPAFTAPSRFPIYNNSYQAILHGTPRADMIRLELPASPEELEKTLHADAGTRKDHPRWYDAQLHLYRRAQSWDNYFIEIYVLQFLSLVFLIGGSGVLTRIGRVLASLAILVTGIFDWLENIRIDAILYPGVPPFAKELVQQVKSASETKWAAFALSCLLLSLLAWQLPVVSKKVRMVLIATLFGAAVTLAIGCFGPRNLLQAGAALYMIMPLTSFWSFVLHPLIRRADRRARSWDAKKEESAGFTMRYLVGHEVEHERVDTRPKEPPKWSLDDFEK